jgi:predicted nuclease of predicted toxin-antitoxin system
LRILLDENLPESLVEVLRALGHDVDSINRLRFKGIDNSTLYREVARRYDLCFTRDAGFVHNVRQMGSSSEIKLLRVMLPQQPAKELLEAFILTFEGTDWSHYTDGDEWPSVRMPNKH